MPEGGRPAPVRDIISGPMEFLAKCPKCDAGLPVSAAGAPESITCGGCGREIPLSVSDALREDRAVDRCPVCRDSDFRGAFEHKAVAFDLHTADVLEMEYERRIGRR